MNQMTPVVEEETSATYDFDPAFQTKILALIARDTQFAVKVKDLIEPEYFAEAAAGRLFDMMRKHVVTYRTAPQKDVLIQMLRDVASSSKIRPDEFDALKAMTAKALTADISNPGFVSDKVIEFAQHQALENTLLNSAELLGRGRFDEVRKLMQQALQVGIVDDEPDYDYFEEIKNRTQMRQDILAGKIVKTGITSGYSEIDANLYHYGWGRKELSVIMGAAKAGKSMSLGDFGKNASLAGHNVAYITLEVSQAIIAERMDAAISSELMRQLHNNHARVDAAVRAAQAKAGKLLFREYASGMMKPSKIDALLNRWHSEGIIIDLLVVDYADIMAAEYRSDSLQENLRSIYIDLRGIAFEHNLALLTATQTNRDGAKAAQPKATDVGDDWNKVRTADLMLGISATEAEKAKGEARLSWLISRNTEDGFSLHIQQDRERMQFIKKILGKHKKLP